MDATCQADSVSFTQEDSLFSSNHGSISNSQFTNSESTNSKCTNSQCSSFQYTTNLTIPQINHKKPVIEHVDDSGDSLDLHENAPAEKLKSENRRLNNKIEILEEKCFTLTCKQLDIKLQESGEIETLLGTNSKLSRENYQLKQQYFELSTQFNDVVQLCNSMVKALEERETVQKQLMSISSLANELEDDVKILHDVFGEHGVAVRGRLCSASDSDSVYYDAVEDPDDL